MAIHKNAVMSYLHVKYIFFLPAHKEPMESTLAVLLGFLIVRLAGLGQMREREE